MQQKNVMRRLFDHTNNTWTKSKVTRGMRLQRLVKSLTIYLLCRRINIKEVDTIDKTNVNHFSNYFSIKLSDVGTEMYVPNIYQYCKTHKKTSISIININSIPTTFLPCTNKHQQLFRLINLTAILGHTSKLVLPPRLVGWRLACKITRDRRQY
jgi:hypothetical protein